MMALSIQQPYAFAIVHGFKPIENRKWLTNFRGEFLVHAGKRELRDDVETVVATIAKQAGRSREEVAAFYERQRHLGAIVGSAVMIDCVRYSDSEWFYGPFGFVLAAARAFEPVACRGQLGFFAAPEGVLQKVRFAASFAETLPVERL